MLTKLKKNRLIFCLFAVFLTFSIACRDEENNNIPLVEVNFQRNLNEPDLLNLQTIGGWVMVSGGSRGIILYRVSSTEIKAYDRHCTFQPSSTSALVSVDANNFTASDQSCGSSFQLNNNGSVSSPPAVTPLKSYTTYINNDILYVTN